MIACGQFTICYQLMDYILELKDEEKGVDMDFTDIDKLYAMLHKDWKDFNKTPFFYIEKLLA